MNVVDIAILLVLAIMILGGIYRGFVSSLISLCVTLLSYGAAMLCLSTFSKLITGNETLYHMLLYYTEGSEYVADTAVELTRANIGSLSLEQLNLICDNADMPLPMARLIVRNVTVESFAGEGVTSLGEYFNRTIVSVVINIFSILLLFLMLRILFGFISSCVEHGRGGYPTLTAYDGIAGAGIGLIHGIILLQLVFLLLPVILTVLPRLYTFIDDSFFGEFFYRANPFLYLIPGT